VSNLRKPTLKTFNKLKQAYGKHALLRLQVFKWYKAFSEGREFIKMNHALEDFQLQKLITMWR
jgi:hypothetical protein